MLAFVSFFFLVAYVFSIHVAITAIPLIAVLALFFRFRGRLRILVALILFGMIIWHSQAERIRLPKEYPDPSSERSD